VTHSHTRSLRGSVTLWVALFVRFNGLVLTLGQANQQSASKVTFAAPL
jgi:hypothetical protein